MAVRLFITTKLHIESKRFEENYGPLSVMMLDRILSLATQCLRKMLEMMVTVMGLFCIAFLALYIDL